MDKKKKNKFSWRTVGQFFYLTTKFFVINKMPTYASACSLGFLFSFIPIMVIIMITIVQFLHTSPDIIFQFIDLPSIFVDSEKIKEIADTITSPGHGNFLTILLVISIMWMGQRFFFSVQTGIKTIFHDKSIKRRPLVENAVLIAGEILL
nr:YihY/virulence factor BrkB family protein [Treponemataceae bacterium]